MEAVFDKDSTYEVTVMVTDPQGMTAVMTTERVRDLTIEQVRNLDDTGDLSPLRGLAPRVRWIHFTIDFDAYPDGGDPPKIGAVTWKPTDA